MVPTMVLVADGTRDARRRDALHGLAEAVSDRREVPVCTAFGTRAELRDIVQSTAGPLVVVPAFLAGSDTASTELLAGLDLGGRFDACMTAPLGAVPSIVGQLIARLHAADWRPGDGIVLAVDGGLELSNDTEHRQVLDVARMLSRRLQTPVQIGYLREWAPSVTDAVARLRRNGHERVAVGRLAARGRGRAGRTPGQRCHHCHRPARPFTRRGRNTAGPAPGRHRTAGSVTSRTESLEGNSTNRKSPSSTVLADRTGVGQDRPSRKSQGADPHICISRPRTGRGWRNTS